MGRAQNVEYIECIVCHVARVHPDNPHMICQATPACTLAYQRAARRAARVASSEPCRACGAPTRSKVGYCNRPPCQLQRRKAHHAAATADYLAEQLAQLPPVRQ